MHGQAITHRRTLAKKTRIYRFYIAIFIENDVDII